MTNRHRDTSAKASVTLGASTERQRGIGVGGTTTDSTVLGGECGEPISPTDKFTEI